MDKWTAKFGAQIKKMRKARRLSQEKLAEKISLDPKFLSQLEIGTRNPSLGTVHKIAVGLDAHVKDLFDFELDSDEMRKEIQKLVTDLNDDAVYKVYRMLKVLLE